MIVFGTLMVLVGGYFFILGTIYENDAEYQMSYALANGTRDTSTRTLIIFGFIILAIGVILLIAGFMKKASKNQQVNTMLQNSYLNGNAGTTLQRPNVVETKVCQQCGKHISLYDKFCNNCGSNVGIQLCPHCRSELQGDSKFCKHCGTKIENQN